MGIFDFFKKKTDVEEYYEKREKEKKEKNIKQHMEKKLNNAKENVFQVNPADTERVDEILRGNYNKIEKIKYVREITGMGLKEAKDLVERTEDGVFPDKKTFEEKISADNSIFLKDLLYSNISKIEKIKRVRELTGAGLKEAKELVEKYEKAQI